MATACPYCNHAISIRDAKAGRFKIACPNCRKKAILTVVDPGKGVFSLTLAAIPGEAFEEKQKQSGPSIVEPIVIRPTDSKTDELSLPSRPDPKPEPVGNERFPTLAGYQIQKLLRNAGTGIVYLARQRSPDRLVALFVMKPEWSENPAILSRVTRQVYAAAQLEQDNLLRIYDFGEDRGRTYVSMEFVDGLNLVERLKSSGALDPDLAVGYILQVARGLKFAHDQNIVGFDVQPENLVVNSQGIVKLADPGFFETAELTESEADSRADFLSLGCTLYTLVTGHPSFDAKSLRAIVKKHSTEPIVVPQFIQDRASKALSDIIVKMVEIRSEDRFASMDDLIRVLEEYLGVPVATPFIPRDEHAQRIEQAAAAFNEGPFALWRPRALLAYHTVSALFFSLFLLARQPVASACVLGLWGATSLTYFLLRGFVDKTELFAKARELLFLNRVADWLTLAVGLIVLLILMVVLGWLIPGIFLLVVASGFAFGFYYGVDLPLRRLRAEPLDQSETLLRSMRLLGLPEESLRRFVCRHSGQNWEEFYEQLFDYEAKRAARDDWGHNPQGKSRPKFAAWRDPIIDWINTKITSRKAERDREKLQPIEEAGFIAEGMNLIVARRRARKSAAAMVEVAAELRESARAAKRDPSAIVVKPRPINDVIREAAQKPDQVLQTVEAENDGPGFLAKVFAALIGGRARFLVGAGLVGLCLLWGDQNGIFSADEIREKVGQAIETGDVNAAKSVKIDYAKTDTKPLKLPMLPPVVTHQFNSLGPGAAGLILIVSALVSGLRIVPFAMAGGIVAFLGSRLPMPKLGPIEPSYAGMALGGAIFLFGLLFGRGRR